MLLFSSSGLLYQDVIEVITDLCAAGAPCISDFPSHRSERVCVFGGIAESQPNALSERIFGLFSGIHLLFDPIGATKGFSNRSERQSVAMTNAHVLVEGDHGRWVVVGSRNDLDLSVPSEQQVLVERSQGVLGYGSSCVRRITSTAENPSAHAKGASRVHVEGPGA